MLRNLGIAHSLLRTTYARDFPEIVVNNHDGERSELAPSRFDKLSGAARYGVIPKPRAHTSKGHMMRRFTSSDKPREKFIPRVCGIDWKFLNVRSWQHVSDMAGCLT
jgi:hypothetical protein